MRSADETGILLHCVSPALIVIARFGIEGYHLYYQRYDTNWDCLNCVTLNVICGGLVTLKVNSDTGLKTKFWTQWWRWHHGSLQPVWAGLELHWCTLRLVIGFTVIALFRAHTFFIESTLSCRWIPLRTYRFLATKDWGALSFGNVNSFLCTVTLLSVTLVTLIGAEVAWISIISDSPAANFY